MNPLETIDAHDWRTIEPHYAALRAEELTPERVPSWLRRWSDLQKVVWEARSALKRPRAADVRDDAAQRAFQQFTQEIMSPFHRANAVLTTKLLALENDDPAPEHRQMLRQMSSAAAIFRAENVALEATIGTRGDEYSRLAGSMVASLDGQEVTAPEVEQRLRDPDRATREAAWRARTTPWLAQRAALDTLFLDLRALWQQQARNAGLADYRTYRWREIGRLDYTPAEALAFHDAIAAEIVPLAARVHDQRRQRLGLDRLRPWDLEADLDAAVALRPFGDLAAFAEGMAGVFARLDPELGALYTRMRRAGFLDLGWRQGKLGGGGGEEWLFPMTGLPYVVVNADGTDDGVLLLLHEMGHAFQDFLITRHQPLWWHLDYPSEVGELASGSLTYLALPMLERAQGGFYAPQEAAEVCRRLLHEAIAHWLPDIALVDAFQHWVFAGAPDDVQPADLDAKWTELSTRFRPWLDMTGLEAEAGAGWQRERALFGRPFLFIAYAVTTFGALQFWRHAQIDPTGTWQAYRAALALGNTATLPDTYATAGIRLPFDRQTVRDVAAFVAPYLDPAMG